MVVLTIDGGITTTRVVIFKEEKIIGRSLLEVGVRETHLTGSKEKLKKGVKKAINLALKKAKIRETQVDLAIASGMITSNLGLLEVPHLSAPINIEKQAKGIVKKRFSEIFPLFIHFIPGIKTKTQDVTLGNIERADFMRGEETETWGILSLKKIKLPAVFILPGSHTKVLRVNKKKEIEKSITFLTGEMIKAIITQTIIGSSLPKKLVTRIDKKFLFKGATLCQKYGLTKTLFSVRLLDQLAKTTPNSRANFFLGIILKTDLLGMRRFLKRGKEIVIGGRKPLRKLYGLLLEKEKGTRKITVLPDKLVDNSSAFGALRIAQLLKK